MFIFSYSLASHNNIYEAIEGSQASVTSIGTETNSLYFCISEGRRNHLKSHKNVGWDYDTCHKNNKSDPAAASVTQERSRKEDMGEITSNKKGLKLKRSLSRTCSSIIESIKSLF